MRICFWSIARGTALGSILGILPGGGALLASFAAYMFEKKIAKPPRIFGEGDIRGVAAPESANNAGAQTSFIPMLTLGIPSNPTMALMIGALMIQGIAPGPQVMTERPELFWGLVASMWVGNLMLLVLNLPLIGLWVKLLAVPYRLLFPAIFVFCCIGVFTVDNKIFDIYVLAALSAVAYVLLKLDCEPAPLILGFILGPMMEEQMRRAMMINFGDVTIFFTRPLSAAFLIAAALHDAVDRAAVVAGQARGGAAGVKPGVNAMRISIADRADRRSGSAVGCRAKRAAGARAVSSRSR